MCGDNGTEDELGMRKGGEDVDEPTVVPVQLTTSLFHRANKAKPSSRGMDSVFSSTPFTRSRGSREYDYAGVGASCNEGEACVVGERARDGGVKACPDGIFACVFVGLA